MKKYIDARKQAGLPVDQTTADESFMRYMVEDVTIPEVEEEYNALYSEEKSE